jgi:hypothetical protein
MAFRPLAFFLLLVLAAAGAAAQNAADSALLPITTFEEPGAPGSLDIAKLRESLRLTMQEHDLATRQVPRIVVFHISQSTADRLDIHTNSVWRNMGRSGNQRYEIYLVGKPSNYLFTYMFENVLEQHFHLNVDESNRSKIIGHVERALDATVDVRSFR